MNENNSRKPGSLSGEGAMPVELYIGSEFESTQEREALSVIKHGLETLFSETSDLCVVLVNYIIQGRQVDLTILKKDAIIIVELKDCHLPFVATENGSWQCPNGHIVGLPDNNPYHQVRGYRIKWKEFLAQQKYKFNCLSTITDERALWHTRGFVAISPSLHPEVDNRISSNNWWFRLIGSDELSEHVSSQTNKHFNFSDRELRLIPHLLGVKKDSELKNDVSPERESFIYPPVVEQPKKPQVEESSVEYVTETTIVSKKENEQSNLASNSGTRKRRLSNRSLAIGITVAILGFFLIGWIISVTVINGTQDDNLSQTAISNSSSVPSVTTVTAGAISQPTFYGTGLDTTVNPPWYPCQENQIKGNKNSKIYHVVNGDFYNKTFHEVVCFDTAAEAEAAGFRASKK